MTRRTSGKRKSVRKPDREPERAYCAKCRGQMPVGHTCPSGNARELQLGNRAVVPVRMTRDMMVALDALAAKRTEARSWPRTTRSTLIIEAVTALLQGGK